MRLEIVARLVLNLPEPDVATWLREENALLQEVNALVRSRLRGAIIIGPELPVASLPVEIVSVVWRADFAMRVLQTFAESAGEVNLSALEGMPSEAHGSVLDQRRRK